MAAPSQARSRIGGTASELGEPPAHRTLSCTLTDTFLFNSPLLVALMCHLSRFSVKTGAEATRKTCCEWFSLGHLAGVMTRMVSLPSCFCGFPQRPRKDVDDRPSLAQLLSPRSLDSTSFRATCSARIGVASVQYTGQLPAARSCAAGRRNRMANVGAALRGRCTCSWAANLKQPPPIPVSDADELHQAIASHHLDVDQAQRHLHTKRQHSDAFSRQAEKDQQRVSVDRQQILIELTR